jgi:hypothetical protein
MGYVNIDGALRRMRDLSNMIIVGENHASTALSLAEQCVEIDEHIICGGVLPKDWELGKKLTWREGKGGSMVLDFNGVGVGHVIPRNKNEPEDGCWTYQADLKPTKDLPYRVETKFEYDAGTLEQAMVACETYVRKQTVTVFDPWKALKEEGIV